MALRGEEREAHRPADADRVDPVEQVVQHAELVAHLRATEHRHVRPQGLLEQATEEEAAGIMRQLLSCLKFMHAPDRKIAHRDLKPENILFVAPTDDSCVKLTDYGFSKRVTSHTNFQGHDDHVFKTRLGSPNYVAPEILSSRHAPYGVEVDMPTFYRLFYYLNRSFRGYGRLDPLMHDPHIEDISCDGPEMPVYASHDDYTDIATNVVFEREELDTFVAMSV